MRRLLLRLAHRKLRHAALKQELSLALERRLDRYMIRWASKLLLVEHVDGEV
jgi:hypothetical protein